MQPLQLGAMAGQFGPIARHGHLHVAHLAHERLFVFLELPAFLFELALQVEHFLRRHVRSVHLRGGRLGGCRGCRRCLRCLRCLRGLGRRGGGRTGSLQILNLQMQAANDFGLLFE